jgi:hypothetical protein
VAKNRAAARRTPAITSATGSMTLRKSDIGVNSRVIVGAEQRLFEAMNRVGVVGAFPSEVKNPRYRPSTAYRMIRQEIQGLR